MVCREYDAVLNSKFASEWLLYVSTYISQNQLMSMGEISEHLIEKSKSLRTSAKQKLEARESSTRIKQQIDHLQAATLGKRSNRGGPGKENQPKKKKIPHVSVNEDNEDEETDGEDDFQKGEATAEIQAIETVLVVAGKEVSISSAITTREPCMSGKVKEKNPILASQHLRLLRRTHSSKQYSLVPKLKFSETSFRDRYMLKYQ